MANARPPFDTFIFDLDGTLLHTLPDLVVLTNRALRCMGYPERTEAEILSFVGNGVRALMYQAVPEGTPEHDAEAAMGCWKELFPRYENNLTHPYPRIEEMVAELRRRGCRVAVLSNKFDAGVRDVIEQHMPGVFEVMHGECDEIPRKPNPTGLLRTIGELESSPERTVYVGDSPGDVLTARNAGAYAAGVAWGYHAVEDFAAEGAEPDFMAHDPFDLLELAPSASLAPAPPASSAAESCPSAPAAMGSRLSEGGGTTSSDGLATKNGSPANSDGSGA